MLIVLHKSATDADIDAICRRVEEVGLVPGRVPGARRTAITVTGNTGVVVLTDVESMPGVQRVLRVTRPYRLATLEGTEGRRTRVKVGDFEVGGDRAWFCAGPCSVDEPERLLRTARFLKGIGAQALRGGAFKPRTNPYAFQGHGEEGLRMLAQVRDEVGLPIVTEAMDVEQVDAVERWADVIQIGARNMQNYALLKRVGEARKPVILKRGLSASLDELLNAAEYVLAGGNDQLILCERGIRTFVDHSRFTLDVAAIPAIKDLSHLPVIVDPSHPAGVRRLVQPLALAGLAAGADGLIVEVHPEPEHALSDGAQALRFDDAERLAMACRGVAGVLGRGFGAPG